MAKCPSCNKDVKVYKEWTYGPKEEKRQKSAIMTVKLYHCECGEIFREYINKKTGKVTRATIPSQKKK
jgi:uncharacterized Zn finger protein